MPVLKTTSPATDPVQPKARPENEAPSSRMSLAFMNLKCRLHHRVYVNNQACQDNDFEFSAF